MYSVAVTPVSARREKIVKENVRKELETLKMMIRNWKESYLRQVTGDGGDEYLVEDFQGEITEYLGPFLTRFVEQKHLTPAERNEFFAYCYRQVEELQKVVQGEGD